MYFSCRQGYLYNIGLYMKQCPTCRTTYTDESLRFCLADGSSLDPVPGNETALLNPMRGAHQNETGASGTAAAKPSTAKIVVVIGLVVLFLLIGMGIALALLYSNRNSRKANARSRGNAHRDSGS